MKVAADSHSLVFYLFNPNELSDAALEALGEAEDTDGVVVSAASLGDLWYASQKAGELGRLTPGLFESLRSTVLDPATRFEVVAMDAETMAYLASFPLGNLRDPWDRMIVATALQTGAPLITRDAVITEAGVVETIW